MLVRFFVFAIAVSLVAQTDSSSEEIFPAKHRALILLKGGMSKDQINIETVPFWAIGGEYRLKPHYYTKMGGGYLQMIFPAMVYHFPSKNEITVDLKIRPDFGPITKWIPLTMVDLGYLYSSRDWFSGTDEQLHSLMLGGWAMIPLKTPEDGIMMFSGSKAIAGDQFTRFSCYAHWFFSDHFGVTIHGDNFTRTRESIKYHYGSFNLGVLFRL